MQTAVSICIPVYNRKDKIINCVNSALNQNYDNFEIILVDNCSTDGTLEAVKEISDKRLKIVKNETNIGAGGNWNESLKQANHDLLLMLHSDDELMPNFVSKAVKFYEEHNKKYPIVVGRGYYTKGKASWSLPNMVKEGSYEAGNEALHTILKNIPHPSVFLAEKKCYEEAGYYNTGKYKENLAEEIFPRLFSRFGFLFLREDAIKIGSDEDQIGNISWTKDYFIHRYAEIKFQHISALEIPINEKLKTFNAIIARVCNSISYSTYKRGNSRLALKYIVNAILLRPWYILNPKVLVKLLLYMFSK